MANDHYTRAYNPQPTQRVASTDLKNEFQLVEGGFTSLQVLTNQTLRQSGGSAVNAMPNAVSRALKVLSFDADGHPRTTLGEADLVAAVSAGDTATAQAGIATTQAGIATTQAGIATAKAAEAAAVADSISGGPVASVMGKTGVVTGIAIDNGVAIVATNTTAVHGTTYAITASVKLTTPTSPNVGDWFIFRNLSGVLTASIGYSDKPIEGASADWTLNNTSAMGRMVYVDATRGWRLFLA